MDNATHKPGGGDKKIETVKLDFKDKAKSKVGSKDNIKHIPGGGVIKVLFENVFINNLNFNTKWYAYHLEYICLSFFTLAP